MPTLTRRTILSSTFAAAALASLPAIAAQTIERVYYVLGPAPADPAAAIETLSARLNTLGIHPVIEARDGRIRVEVDVGRDHDIVPVLLRRMGYFAIYDRVQPARACPKTLRPGEKCLAGRDERDGVFLLPEDPALGGDVLAAVSMTYRRDEDRPQLAFRLKPEAARTFGKVTSLGIGTIIAVEIDGEIVMAPRVAEPIMGGSGIVTGAPDDVRLWAALLGPRPLDARLEILKQGSAVPVVRGKRRR